MKFTVVFSSEITNDASFGLVFVPCPIWVQGEHEVLNLNPERPNYQLGSVRRLLETERVSEMVREERNTCVVVIHDVGHGSFTDLTTLVEDLQNEGFKVVQLRV